MTEAGRDGRKVQKKTDKETHSARPKGVFSILDETSRAYASEIRPEKGTGASKDADIMGDTERDGGKKERAEL